MKKLIVMSTTFIMIALLTADCTTDYGCKTDSDCRVPRVCNNSACVDPTSNTSEQPTLISCGVVDLDCNCAYTTAYPGQISSGPRCQSGQHQFEVCPGTCGAGFPWRTRCYCQ
jgi:hypothetical protein